MKARVAKAYIEEASRRECEDHLVESEESYKLRKMERKGETYC